MEHTSRFYDFCVPYNSNSKIMCALLDELVELGYKTIAIEQTYDMSKNDSNKRGADPFPEPVKIQDLIDAYKVRLKILQRITILYTDGSGGNTHSMNTSSNLKKFNLVAGQPKTDAALVHCCTVFNGDLITFDPSGGSKLLINRKSYEIAVQRGLFFEIKYSPAIADSNNRKDIIKIAANYFVKGKSRNIIFSSGAAHEFQLRGPYDVANLAFILSLSPDQGKNAIDRNCRQLFLRAESRRIGKTIMLVKCNGPVVFSDTSDDESMEADEVDNLNTNNTVKQDAESQHE